MPNIAPAITDVSGLRPAAAFEQPYLLTLGQWNRNKNVRTALRAFQLFRERHPEYHYVLLGSGLEKDGEAHAWAQQRGLANNVYFGGLQPRELGLAAVTSAALYLQPSYTEACSMAVLEAMAAGVPVVGGYKTGGLPWQLDYGKAGRLTNIENPRELAGALDSVASDPAYRSSLACHAKTLVKDVFAAEPVAQAYETIYQSILEATQPKLAKAKRDQAAPSNGRTTGANPS